MKMHRSIYVSVFGSESFSRHGLQRLLAEYGFVTDSFFPERAKDRDVDPIGGPHIILADTSDQNPLDICRSIAPRMPNARIALLVKECSDEDMVELLASGVAGILHETCRCTSLVQYLRLIAFDQRVVASQFIEDMIKPKDPVDLPPLRERRLSEREQQVSSHIARGLPNKEIARLTGLAEQTVKVHLKAIMRKLRVANRTQLALRVNTPSRRQLPHQSDEMPVFNSMAA
jgi:two-component system nitrate/nitrite response regulator NarL